MSMKYLAAYALASLAKPAPTADDVKAICKASGVKVEEDSLAFVMEAIDGRSVNTLIAEGVAKMSAVSVAAAPAAGGAAAPAAGGAAAGGAAAPAKKQEVEEEEDDDMGFGLFD
ncbi:60S acidic ribosomal protein, putative [Trypanosoma equiperdum]|uniref:60S acidic ribosomal protein, putative n=4 Tax=Trypanozoon TaxID=39700 RepID=Q38EY6_TRYB2|nr:60S acidic ribosomal protein, putative [Trypanosoma brucei gambiense DAL972]XP_826964.1 60S acidic ribosomal protein [Trypanosoma brucei brucei TREU927]RHW70397.1 60S acidic ribosomal protein [Trypanosoma brucei equiperdum]SCU67964.1 60S acidic ribosomal protein, putative [Trypanosoma equiperdum]EAN76634.1 60S acidic ribosomal protein, putative [Trypanosoma brucei brucei TREU927]CBH14226.1 60S acidic ribosomal protein, putative [Trypanosoma brucei gambiense DAL972]|eukprot:XP_011776496.1 60S acidic ribosomal protein, putative [Trypanosoma brucei gambiense DAL972]